MAAERAIAANVFMMGTPRLGELGKRGSTLFAGL
jgi:hypothetical protein